MKSIIRIFVTFLNFIVRTRNLWIKNPIDLETVTFTHGTKLHKTHGNFFYICSLFHLNPIPFIKRFRCEMSHLLAFLPICNTVALWLDGRGREGRLKLTQISCFLWLARDRLDLRLYFLIFLLHKSFFVVSYT